MARISKRMSTRAPNEPRRRAPRPRFRETLWFKKGWLDAEEAWRAAEDDDDLRPDAFDLLPLEDRYRDDGSISRADSAAFGLHTGTTQRVRPIPAGATWR